MFVRQIAFKSRYPKCCFKNANVRSPLILRLLGDKRNYPRDLLLHSIFLKPVAKPYTN
ncbi:hypothetical protein H6G96_27230 [Nostoc sp. FACHB-892]|uniref:hypothetical protein n=1 Tax=Nostoc sp. FACHB-892 TaxID=2692843 RepID=UPI0016874CD7|nr:hypothetical protein [Nostoc sp. FACHB-892]MBD2729912.1 hypothetical protein [Nostoc sp. FACHB-892]